MSQGEGSLRSGTLTWIGSTRTRSKLIEATARAALKHGLRTVTVRHILEEACLSRRTFYQHFRSKEQAALSLYRSVCTELVSEVHRGIKSAEDLDARLAAGVDAYLAFHRQVGDLFTMLRAEAVEAESPLAPLRVQTIDTLCKLVDNEFRKSEGMSLDLMVYRCVFVGMEGLVAWTREDGRLVPPDFDRVADTAKGIFTALIAAVAELPPGEED